MDGRPVGATISIGLVFSEDGLTDMPTLLGQADQALYYAKERGRLVDTQRPTGRGEASEHGLRVAGDNLEALTAYSVAVQQALEDLGLRGEDGGLIDHIELFADDAEADSRNFVLCPGKAYDRSPCGTGTSAKLACLAADGKLQPGQLWRQASVIGSQFEASYEHAEGGRIIPTIRGRAHLSAEATLLIEADDPFAWGIRL